MDRRRFLQATGASVACGLTAHVPAWGNGKDPATKPFHFDFVTDPHTMSGAEAYGVGGTFEELVIPHLYGDNVGLGEFLLTSGDIDVFHIARDSIQEKLIAPAAKAGKNYRWYPIPGNHDSTNTSTRPGEHKDGANLKMFWQWMKEHHDNVKWSVSAKTHDAAYGPYGEGLKYVTYSWDYRNCHFVSFNLYAADLTRTVAVQGCKL